MQSTNIEIERKRGRIGIGVIGCGSRMKDILRWLLELNNQYEIVGIYDTQKQTIENYKEIFGKNIKVYDDCNSLVNNSTIDWILIGSINSAHKEHIIAAFNADKNVFCEKPLAISIS